MQPYVADVVELLMGLIRVENEENAILCLKIAMDLGRYQVEATKTKIQPFLDLIQEIFETMEQVVKDTFPDDTNEDEPLANGPVPAPGIASLPAPGARPGLQVSNPQVFQSPRPSSPLSSSTAIPEAGANLQTETPEELPKGMQSFKVFAECPIIVVSILQAHRTIVPQNVKKFVPLIKLILMLQAKPQERAHAEAAERGEIFTDVCKSIKNRALFGDFINAQVKVMSFMAYLLRVHSQQLNDFLPTLPDIVVRLLRDCPSERSATRKELLVAIRHAINFNFRKIFLIKIDELLDERTLIGDGLTVYETMRPLAYSLLADLIHHVRDSLNRDQIRRTVAVFSKNLHDNFPGTSFQTMSAKLLLNMAESIANLKDKNDARHFLIAILNAIAQKFATMNRQYHNAVKLSKIYEQHSMDAAAEDHLKIEEKPDWDEIDIFTAGPIKTSNPKDRGANPVEDNKFLFKNLLTGLKGVFYQLRLCNPEGSPLNPAAVPPNWQDISYGYDSEEVEVITKLFREGAHVFRYYFSEQTPTETNYTSPLEILGNHYMVQSGKDEKELLEAFATVFHSIDPATFHEVFHQEIPHLYEMMFEHTALLHVPQFFLASEATSPAFAGMLLQFVMDRIGEVGSSDIKKASILLRMFKLAFMAVTLYSTQNEPVLLPHVANIITKSIQLSTSAQEPINYFYLLRSLFRSIGGGRFELLYKEILPLLEMLLEVLNNLLVAARKPMERDLYVELCLTVPARLSNLLPHLSYLMRPLVVALRAGSDLVGQGLRTLELCVDNLTSEYLDPIMAPVIDELMTALWDHLRPNPYSHFHAHTTMRILGKLGGRNRKWMTAPPELEYVPFADDQCSIDIRFMGASKLRPFPSGLGLDLAISRCTEVSQSKSTALKKAEKADAGDPYYRQQALRLIDAQIKLHIGYENLPEDFARLVRLHANDLVEGNVRNHDKAPELADRTGSVPKVEMQETSLRKLLRACVVMMTQSDLAEAASSLMENVCRHCTILEVGKSLVALRAEKRDFNVRSGEGQLSLDSCVLANVIGDTLSSDHPAVREAAEKCLQFVCRTAATIFGKAEVMHKVQFFSYLVDVFCHNCHQEDWLEKAGGGLGIRLLITITNLDVAWITSRQPKLLRALLYVVKDMPQDLPSQTRMDAAQTIDTLLRMCNRGVTKDDLHTPQSKLLGICNFFVYELAHANKHVREIARNSFSTMAELAETEIPMLLTGSVKDRLLIPIFQKPVRALPLALQIGYIEAVTYCLNSNVLEYSDALNRLLLECLVSAEVEDEHFTNRPSEHRTASLIIGLRVACMNLLSRAMNLPDFVTQAQQQQPQTQPQSHQGPNTSPFQIRSKIIQIFFKSLYVSSSEIINAAYAGFKSILGPNNKIPKDLLQIALRPVLLDIQDPQKLNVRGLQGLARILSLLENSFRIEIGERLLVHMKVIADAQTLTKSSFTLLEQNSQMQIIVAILNVFHLLPSQAAAFMAQLIKIVMDLESSVRRTQSSPFREPLLKYLNRYSTEAWSFFSHHLSEHKFGRFWAQILAEAESGPLREVVIADIEGLVKASLEPQDLEEPGTTIADAEQEADSMKTKSGTVLNGGQQETSMINAIHIVHSLCRFSGDWLKSHVKLRIKLLDAGTYLHQKIISDAIEPSLRLSADRAGMRLLHIFIMYLQAVPSDLDFLFQISEVLCLNRMQLRDDYFRFLYETIICKGSIEEWRSIATRCFDLYNTASIPNKFKAFMFRNLVNPIFARDFQTACKPGISGQRLLDKSMVEAILNKLWKPRLSESAEESLHPGVDHCRLELLQMTSFLLKYHHTMVLEARKEIIKLAWTSITLEDVISKWATYVLISFFIARFDTPPKIASQVYSALLKAHQPEGRALVIQGLDLIAPVIPKRLGSWPEYGPLKWAKPPRDILREDGSNLNQLNSVFQYIVRQPALLYDARGEFVHHIISSLTKLAPFQSASNEHKKLVLRLIELIWRWEDWRVNHIEPLDVTSQDNPQLRRLRPESTHNTTPSRAFHAAGTDRKGYLIDSDRRASILKYLAQFICVLPERYTVLATRFRELQSNIPQPTLPPNDMCRKALWLFHDLFAIQGWETTELALVPKLGEQFLKSEKMDKADEKLTTVVVNTLQVLRIHIDARSDSRILDQLETIQRLIEKPLKSEQPEIQDSLHAADFELDGDRSIRPLLRRVLDALPVEENVENSDMEVETPASEFIAFLSSTASDMLLAGNNIAGINILWTLAQVKSAKIEQFIPQLIKVLSQTLAKEILPQPNSQSAAQQGLQATDRQGPDARTIEISSNLALKAIDVISDRMANLTDHRRPFLGVLASLVERSHHVKLCEKILHMVETWVFNATDPWPTLKEKTAVLHKMLAFEHRSPALMLKFLDLVIRIYEDPNIARTELTVRLEDAFLIGTRAQDVTMRNRFLNVFSQNLTSTPTARLFYIVADQNWNTLSGSFWLSQAIQLLFGVIEKGSNARLHEEDFRMMSPAQVFGKSANDPRSQDLMLDDSFEDLMARHQSFYAGLDEVKVRDILDPLCQLQHIDPQVAKDIWVALFPLCWQVIAKDDRSDLERSLVALMTRDYHNNQADERPNVIQALLEGVVRARPICKMPPQVLRILSRTHNAYHTAMVSLEDTAVNPLVDTHAVRESNYDALVEIYANLHEDDFYYGAWRRRCRFIETNAALSFEQNGMWEKAQSYYEAAQIKARTGSIPFSQAEYMLWEDHWILCAEKLQQWDILADFAKHENFNDLYLEASWRSVESWHGQEFMDQVSHVINSVSDAPTPRRAFFQSFMSLLKFHEQTEALPEFTKTCDEAIQLSIRKWHQLPRRITNAHIPILQNFQQLVELHDANVICSSLAQTTQQNLDQKSAELKLLLGTWRDRLPNLWDDINSWQDLVTWRQHIFQMINRTYLALLPAPQGNTHASQNSYAYRGYHESAWIINRFAHVARKHHLPEVCIGQLNRIYTLPNIEIQEAFLKLREQAKCHFQNTSELNSGLEVINNTNLNYFGQNQKAEFFTLKGMFLNKLGQKDEANDAYGTALYYEIRLPKAWAEWGYYNDQKFQAQPTDLEAGAAAVSCYLEAAGVYKSAKSRKFLSRVLWLLSIDSAENKISQAFQGFKGETPTWYWITFIPQLLTSLSSREARMTKEILMKIAKQYPQALFFQLRTTREDLLAIKKTQDQKQERMNKSRQQQSPAMKQGSPTANQGVGSGNTSRPNTSNGDHVPNGDQTKDTNTVSQDAEEPEIKKPWEHADELMLTLKTQFPLLSMSMETIVDAIQKNFKCPPDEDAYRLIVALLNDGLNYIHRQHMAYAQNYALPAPTEANIRRFAESVLPTHIRPAFEEDFVTKKPTMYEYIQRLRVWRDKFEEKLDRRPSSQSLEMFNHHLSDFRYTKLDEVEVPGQYLEHRDRNQDFIRIDRFCPNVDLVRTNGFSHRRLKIRGHDGSLHSFAVQHPAARHSRREERVLQLFRILNTILAKRKESRRRNLGFNLPLIVPLAGSLRLVQDDPTYISLQSVYEDHCRRNGAVKDEPILFTMERLRSIGEKKDLVSNHLAFTSVSPQGILTFPQKDPRVMGEVRLQIFNTIQSQHVPSDLVLDYFRAIYPSFEDFWLFRRQFTHSFASLTFLTYIMFMTTRYPHRYNISRRSGSVVGHDLMPTLSTQKPVFNNNEPVPFRLTPNIQKLMGPIATEGVFAPAIMAIARSLTEPEPELKQWLSVFVRDEVVHWFTSQRHANVGDGSLNTQFRDMTWANSDLVVKRAQSLAKTPEGTLPAGQTIIDAIGLAVKPDNLKSTEPTWMPWL